MKIFKKISDFIQNMSFPYAILLGSLIIGLSIFITVWVFFGGPANKSKLFSKEVPRTIMQSPTNYVPSQTTRSIPNITTTKSTTTKATTTPIKK